MQTYTRLSNPNIFILGIKKKRALHLLHPFWTFINFSSKNPVGPYKKNFKKFSYRGSSPRTGIATRNFKMQNIFLKILFSKFSTINLTEMLLISLSEYIIKNNFAGIKFDVVFRGPWGILRIVHIFTIMLLKKIKIKGKIIYLLLELLEYW